MILSGYYYDLIGLLSDLFEFYRIITIYDEQ